QAKLPLNKSYPQVELSAPHSFLAEGALEWRMAVCCASRGHTQLPHLREESLPTGISHGELSQGEIRPENHAQPGQNWGNQPHHGTLFLELLEAEQTGEECTDEASARAVPKQPVQEELDESERPEGI
ncbi:hypothetical protein M9458_033165, partial [Cirrhinus mrigala]